MKCAQEAMNQMLVYNVGMLLTMIVGIVFSFTWRESNKTYPYGIALCLLAAYHLYFFVPFIGEYAKSEIIVQEGEYENSTTGRRNTHSRFIGLKSVKLKTEKGELRLTTVPGYKNVFVEGKYNVRAYYLEKSKILLYIEIL